jgi:hypothetical protein
MQIVCTIRPDRPFSCIAGSRGQRIASLHIRARRGFAARAVGESIFTEADMLEELRANLRSAAECHFEEGQAPKVIRLHIERDEILAP